MNPPHTHWVNRGSPPVRGMLGEHTRPVHYEVDVHEVQAWAGRVQGRARSDQGIGS